MADDREDAEASLERELPDNRLKWIFRVETDRIQQVGRFEILRELGQGAFGVVFLARDPTLERLVALKLCPMVDSSRLDELMTEARLLAKCSHPNIVTVFEAGQTDIYFYCAMEFIDGYDGADYIDRWISWREVVKTYEAAATGLAAAHQQGVIHGDFKPSNLLISKDGRVVVADFGIARLIDRNARREPDPSNLRGGTVAYMAPELFRGYEPDEHSDQWALCVSLWQTLHRGKLPFTGESMSALARAMHDGPPRAQWALVPPPLEDVLQRGLSPEREERPRSMGALVRELRVIRKGAAPERERRSWSSWATAGLAMLMVFAGVLAVIGFQQTRLKIAGESSSIAASKEDRELDILRNRAIAAAKEGRHDEAIDLLAKAESKLEEDSDRVALAETADEVGLALLKAGAYREAADAHGRAQLLYVELGKDELAEHSRELAKVANRAYRRGVGSVIQ